MRQRGGHIPRLQGGDRAGARADLAVPFDVLQDFERSPARYRLEAEVGGVWRATALDFAGCASIE